MALQAAGWARTARPCGGPCAAPAAGSRGAGREGRTRQGRDHLDPFLGQPAQCRRILGVLDTQRDHRIRPQLRAQVGEQPPQAPRPFAPSSRARPSPRAGPHSSPNRSATTTVRPGGSARILAASWRNAIGRRPTGPSTSTDAPSRSSCRSGSASPRDGRSNRTTTPAVRPPGPLTRTWRAPSGSRPSASSASACSAVGSSMLTTSPPASLTSTGQPGTMRTSSIPRAPQRPGECGGSLRQPLRPCALPPSAAANGGGGGSSALQARGGQEFPAADAEFLRVQHGRWRVWQRFFA